MPRPSGTISGIIQTDDGFYIVEVRGNETRDTTDDIRTDVADRAFNVAIKEARKTSAHEIVMDANQLNRLANRFRTSLNTSG